MNTAKIKTSLGLLLLAALILSSACDNSLGFLSSIQTETVQSSNKLFVQTATRDIVEFGGSYYAVTKGIYTRSTASGGAWSLVSNASFGDNYRCAGIAQVSNTTLYAAIYGGDTFKGIFSSVNGSTWSPVDTSALTSQDVQGLYAVNNHLFAASRTSTLSGTTYTYSYALHHLTGAAFDAAAISGATSPFVAGIHDGAAYWFAAGKSLYSGTTATMTAQTETGLPTDKTFTGLAANGAVLYLATTDRLVYRRTAVNTWNSISLSSTTTEVPSGIAFIADPAATPRLVVGLSASSNGYYEVASDLSGSAIACTNSSGILMPAASASSNSLKDKPVVKFARLGNSLFACAASGSSEASSLWRNDWNGSIWTGWVAE